MIAGKVCKRGIKGIPGVVCKCRWINESVQVEVKGDITLISERTQKMNERRTKGNTK
jgi:hypothetical protein